MNVTDFSVSSELLVNTGIPIILKTRVNRTNFETPRGFEIYEFACISIIIYFVCLLEFILYSNINDHKY